MKIAILGTGGVEGYFGARLAQAGEDVFFIARGSHLHIIRENGLQVKNILGDFAIRPAKASDDPVKIGPVDLIILGVKAWQVPGAAEAMKPLIGAETIVCHCKTAYPQLLKWRQCWGVEISSVGCAA